MNLDLHRTQKPTQLRVRGQPPLKVKTVELFPHLRLGNPQMKCPMLAARLSWALKI